MSLNTASSRPLPVGSVVAETASASASAVSWAAIFAGAFGAVAVSIILIELGLGLGLASVSPWTSAGSALATLGVAGGIWLILTQWISAGIGGYLAGRLRTKWTGLHTDEVFFRDTAHGFLAWSLGTVIGVLLIAAGSASLLNTAGRAAGAAAGGAGVAAIAANQNDRGGQIQPFADPYFADMLLRPAPPSTTSTTGAAAVMPSGNGGPAASTGNGSATNAGNGAATSAPGTEGAAAAPAGAASPMAAIPTATPANNNAAPNARGGGQDSVVVTRIFARDLPSGNLSPDDRTYVAQIVAAHTGMSQAEAAQRVDATVAQIKSAEDQAKQAADKARKAAAFGSIATALAMVVGAFIAAVSGALGGRLRDEYHV